MLLMLSGKLPLFLSVTGIEVLLVLIPWLPKVRLTGERAAPGPVAEPTIGSTAGDPVKLPVISKNPENNPAAVGANVASKVQLAPADIVPGQWFTTLKGKGHDTPLMLIGLVVVLVKVTVWIGLAVLMAR